MPVSRRAEPRPSLPQAITPPRTPGAQRLATAPQAITLNTKTHETDPIPIFHVGQHLIRPDVESQRHSACRHGCSSPTPRVLYGKTTMNKTLIALLAAAVATLSLGAQADTVTQSQADAQKTVAKGDYKADKAQAKTDYNANRQECKDSTSGAVERACKKDAKAQEKQDKADAKLDYKQDKADIKANTK